MISSRSVPLQEGLPMHSQNLDCERKDCTFSFIYETNFY
jgi:hypothetical protein